MKNPNINHGTRYVEQGARNVALFQDPRRLPPSSRAHTLSVRFLVLEMPVAHGNGPRIAQMKVRMFFPAQRKGFGKFIYAFREYYEPELAYLEKILSPGGVFV